MPLSVVDVAVDAIVVTSYVLGDPAPVAPVSQLCSTPTNYAPDVVPLQQPIVVLRQPHVVLQQHSADTTNCNLARSLLIDLSPGRRFATG